MKIYCCYGMYAEVGHDDDCPTRKNAASPQPAAQPEPICRTDGRCQYAIDHGTEGLGHCPQGKCAMPEQSEPGVLTDERIKAVCDAIDFSDMVTADDYIYVIARAVEREVLSTRKLSDEQVARVMEAVESYALGCADFELTVTERRARLVKVERLLRGEA